MELFNTNDYQMFSEWLNHLLTGDLPNGIVAFNFNIYEGEDETYDIQLIGSEEFDENDSDWACSDYYTSEEDICYIKRTKNIEEWEDGLAYIIELVKHYLKDGKHANILKNVTATSVGFVDGDLTIVYPENM